MNIVSRILSLCFLSVFLLACSNGDIEDLQKQIDDLNEKIEQNEDAQKEELLAEIAKMEEALADMSGDYNDLVSELDDMKNKIDEDSDDVFYGNVLTDEDYSSFSESGASIVSGKVVITNIEQVALLENLEMVGTSLTFNTGGDINLENLKNVGQSLLISGVEEDLSLTLPNLKSLGGDFLLTDNLGLKSIDFANLVFVGGQVYSVGNSEMHTFSLPMLDFVSGDFYFVNADQRYSSRMSNFDISFVNVEGDVTIMSLGYEDMEEEDYPSIELGGAKNLVLYFNLIKSLNYNGETLSSLEMIENYKLGEMNFDNLTRINGDITIKDNNGGLGSGTSGSSNDNVTLGFGGFDNLEYIEGDVIIKNNTVVESIEGFNKVTTVAGYNIEFSSNGEDAIVISIFNSLVSSEDEYTRSYSIIIRERATWISSFNSLKTVNSLYVAPSVKEADVCKLSGFESLEIVQTNLSLELRDVTDFDAFSNVTDFKGTGEGYLSILMPEDESVTLCSMNTLLTAVKNGDFDEELNVDKVPLFYDYLGNPVTVDFAIDTLTNGCN